MASNIANGADHNHANEIIIKINLEDVFHGRQCHEEDDPGKVILYVIKVQKKTFELRESEMRGRQILALVGYTPTTHRLYEIGNSQREVGADELVSFRKPGIERFHCVARQANEGKGATEEVAPSSIPFRRQIELPQADKECLNRMGLPWETIMQGNIGWILIHNFPIPKGYNVTTTAVAFMIPASYPNTEFDMMYFSTPLKRIDGHNIGALSTQMIDSNSYQRWSRHRNPGVWIPGVDNLETHILSVKGWLEDELLKGK